MATDKMYKLAGITKQPNGEYKVRFGTDNVKRFKVLMSEGHTDIRLAEFEQPKSKYDGIRAIQSMDEFQDAIAQSVIADYLDEKAPRATKVATVATKQAETV